MYLKSRLLEKAVENLSSLPGIGKRTALRLVLSLLKKNKNTVQNFGNSFIELVNNIKYCNNCHAISETDLCRICTDHRRDHSQICVVEDIRVLLAIENTMQYKGIYHVLGGLISPMDGIGPDDLKIDDLINKVSTNNIKEVIFALSTTMEGDTTNFYIYKQLEDSEIKITTIARGVSVGNELEFTDEVTLGRSIIKRIPFENSIKNIS